jgi:hypothetical protein
MYSVKCDVMMKSKVFGKIWPFLLRCHGICLYGMERTTKTRSHNGACSCRDSNFAPVESKSRVSSFLDTNSTCVWLRTGMRIVLKCYDMRLVSIMSAEIRK